MELYCEKVWKNYGSVVGLQEFTYTFGPGIYGLLGPNGSGKSTLINMLTDNVSRTGGEISWDGTDILSLGRVYRKLIGYMPQQQGFFPDLSVMAFMRYLAELKGIPHRQSREECQRRLDQVGIVEWRNRPIGQLSVGMRQRVLLAQALLGEPSILFLDEPTAGLDPKERIRIRNLISKLGGDKIIILATHIVSDVELIADQILLMNRGKLCKQGRVSELENELAGKVLLYKIEEAERHVGKNCLAGNTVRRGDDIWMHLVGDELPPDGVQPEAISLDDVYLYWTGDTN